MNRIVHSAIVVAGLVCTLSAVASWGQVPSDNDKSDSQFNTGGGTRALANNFGSNNTAYGDEALKNARGNSNTAIGYR